MSAHGRTNGSSGITAAEPPIVVPIVGELDAARAGELLEIAMALDAPPDTVVELDLSEVGFVDSRGLQSILNAKAYLDGRQCELRIVGPQRHFLRLVKVTGLAEALGFAAAG
jgi:anti-anti-sigma factor